MQTYTAVCTCQLGRDKQQLGLPVLVVYQVYKDDNSMGNATPKAVPTLVRTPPQQRSDQVYDEAAAAREDAMMCVSGRTFVVTAAPLLSRATTDTVAGTCTPDNCWGQRR